MLTVCRQYKEAIAAKDLEQVQNLFTEDASITTPLHGTLQVVDYHEMLFRTTRQAISRLLNVFEGMKGAPSIALYLDHTLILNNGKTLQFKSMDVYEFTSDRQRFASLNILFNPEEVKVRLGMASVQKLVL